MKPAVVRDVWDMKLLLWKLNWVVQGVTRSCLFSCATPANLASMYVFDIFQTCHSISKVLFGSQSVLWFAPPYFGNGSYTCHSIGSIIYSLFDYLNISRVTSRLVFDENDLDVNDRVCFHNVLLSHLQQPNQYKCCWSGSFHLWNYTWKKTYLSTSHLYVLFIYAGRRWLSINVENCR